ncbi:unnamed protein product [Calypogeia fissa]
MSEGGSPSSGYKLQLGVKMDSTTSRFPSSPPNAISHKYWESKQPLQPPEARALAFLRKLDRECCKLTFPEDITFLVEGNEQIHAHRFILASKSPVFRKMFESQMKETRTGEIQILDASAPVIRGMVDFCYTAEINFGEQVYPDEVLKVAHKYDLPELKCEAECELLKRLTEANLVEALELSCTYQAEIVKQRCIDYLAHSIRVNSLNLCSLLRISYKYDVVPLKVRALEFFRQNFESLKFVVMDDLLSE